MQHSLFEGFHVKFPQPDTYPFDKDSDYFPRPAKLPKRREDIKVREQEIYREMMNTEFTVDDVQITKEIDHRDQLKKVRVN